MNDLFNTTLSLAPACLAGVALGAFFFGGLWWTVHKSMSAKSPALWMLGSLLLRMGIVLGGFYLVAEDNWKRWLSCLLGFVMARLLATLLAHLSSESGVSKESRHAPQS
jgi:F1F0 ATPase subunit 2